MWFCVEAKVYLQRDEIVILDQVSGRASCKPHTPCRNLIGSLEIHSDDIGAVRVQKESWIVVLL
jgi:hypothetical protein